MKINPLDSVRVRRTLMVTECGTDITRRLDAIPEGTEIVTTVAFINLRETSRGSYLTGIEVLDSSLRALSGIPHMLEIRGTANWRIVKKNLVVEAPHVAFRRLKPLGQHELSPGLTFRRASIGLTLGHSVSFDI